MTYKILHTHRGAMRGDGHVKMKVHVYNSSTREDEAGLGYIARPCLKIIN
jgi:hypothetical protein